MTTPIFGPVMPVAYLYHNEVLFLLTILLISDEPPFERPTSTERPLGGTPRVTAQWRVNCILKAAVIRKLCAVTNGAKCKTCMIKL